VRHPQPYSRLSMTTAMLRALAPIRNIRFAMKKLPVNDGAMRIWKLSLVWVAAAGRSTAPEAAAGPSPHQAGRFQEFGSHKICACADRFAARS